MSFDPRYDETPPLHEFDMNVRLMDYAEQEMPVSFILNQRFDDDPGKAMREADAAYDAALAGEISEKILHKLEGV